MKKSWSWILMISAVLVLAACAPAKAPQASATGRTEGLSDNEKLVKQYAANIKKEAIPSKDFTLTDLQGKQRKLSDYRGKIVLLNFWATWCGPCQMEMPAFQQLYDRFGEEGDVVVLAVASSANEGLSQQASLDTVKGFIDKMKYTFPVPYDADGSVWSVYMQQGIPANYILDKQGNIRLLVMGAFQNEDYMYAALEAVRRADAE